MSWVEGARARLRLLFARGAAEARMDHEFRFHLEMETERLMREQGLDADEARRRAVLAFGGVEKHREALREDRGLAWFGGLSLDLKLGFRMLVKYPGLTVVGGLAMAFAIWIGVVTFAMVGLFLNPTLPLPDGDRIVQIGNWDVAASSADPRALHDFVVWRRELRTVTDLGAWREVTLNLITGDGSASPVPAAEITASAFRIAPAPPLLGRTLVAADEQAGAPAVVVLGHDVWRSRFAADPNVVGRSVQLGDAHATVVGVMPDGFAFPVAHELWVPLRPDALEQGPLAGPAITVFGRLARGVSLATAQAELTTLGRRFATQFPDTHEHLQPRVAPYAKPLAPPSTTEYGSFLSIPFFAAVLLVLVCGNVALLLFARAATREGEIVVRAALGASRGRIVAQLFTEALVLAGLALVVGLAAARFSLGRWGMPYLEVNLGRVPFWLEPALSPAAVLYAGALSILAAAVAGVLPGLKVTRGLGSRLRQGTAGAGGLRFGGVWTAVIVAQVAVTVAFPAVAFVMRQEMGRIEEYDPGFATEEYLAVSLDMDPMPAGQADGDAQTGQNRRFAAALEALRERVASQPGVEGVAFVDRLPRLYHRERRIELDDDGSLPAPAGGATSTATQDGLHEVYIAAVDPAYFEVLDAPILAGRGFGPVDLQPDARAVIVDQGFVDQVLRGQNPIGRRLRFAAAPNADPGMPEEARPWYEIVGVVPELGMRHVAQRGRPAGLYLPTAPGSAGPLHMVVHVRGDPMSLAPQVQTMAAAVDPMLRLSELQRLDRVVDNLVWFIRLWLRITLVLSALALVLSLAGIYAVLSFTVARRTREIGVRVALGASRSRLVTDVFRRPLTQVGLGVAAGGVLTTAAVILPSGGGLTVSQYALLVSYVTLMLGVCLLACVVPTWRALRIEPTQALRAD